MVNEVLKNKCDTFSWQEWRVQKLWTLEVDDLYRSNQKELEKLYKYYFVQKKTKVLYLEDAQNMFGAAANLGLLPEHVSQCWGMSQMTVENDITSRLDYLRCNFQEFLEFFARIADVVYKERHSSLVSKIERLMDHMFHLLETKRKPVVIEVQYISQSEDELEEMAYLIKPEEVMEMEETVEEEPTQTDDLN